jgi:hypothetical protein
MYINIYINLTHVLYLSYGSGSCRTLKNNMNHVDQLFNVSDRPSDDPSMDCHYLDLCLDLWTNIYVLVCLANVCDVLCKLLYVILCLLLYTHMPILEASHRRRGQNMS